MTANNLYGRLPSVDRLLHLAEHHNLPERHGRTNTLVRIRQLLDEARQVIRQQQQLPSWIGNRDIDEPQLCRLLADGLEKQSQPGQRRVFNLTGTILHTNLGRAQQAEAAIAAVTQVMRHPATLEYSLANAQRGHRDQAISQLLQELIGCEDACIVNNNAAAVLIMLATMAAGKEVIVSRGELVEIGGSFRIPDVMKQAGCKLVEVGATNRTHLRDYQQAITAQTALLMKVHTSNYMIQGFTSAVSESKLCQLGKEQQLPVVSDLGSGSLINLAEYGLPAEPMPQSMIADGINLVSFSGDKLLGGPQAGIIAGDKELIEQIQHHPLKRALRCDKMTLASLEATLNLYRHPERLPCELPTLAKLTRPLSELNTQAQRLLPVLRQWAGSHFHLQAEPSMGQIGSGALPTEQLMSIAITFNPKSGSNQSLHHLAEQLAGGNIPIIGRIHHDKLWLCMRGLSHEADFIEQINTLIANQHQEIPA
ncbi:L-seryl-tRNA(Sec) selenium transferase [Photobacterium sp. J15]|uniref:L-seryl-tRNA(Sec) selenium transferase n=1 Tax=Photobacterium sp. J15 TaxID=265901 RepID=UPI0007E3E619|nr:L-seryl-tRNA(Sec) selenium transferase [Photobacterium sp. J15]